MINFSNYFKKGINIQETVNKIREILQLKGNKKDIKKLYRSMDREDKLNTIEEIIQEILDSERYKDYDKVIIIRDLYLLLDEKDRATKMTDTYRQLLDSDLSRIDKSIILKEIYIMIGKKMQLEEFSNVIEQILNSNLEISEKLYNIQKIYNMLEKREKLSRINEMVQQILATDLIDYDRQYIIIELYRELEENDRASKISLIVQKILESDFSEYDKKDSIKTLYRELREEDKTIKLTDITQQILNSKLSDYNKKELYNKLYEIQRKEGKTIEIRSAVQQVLNSELSKEDKQNYIITIWKKENGKVQIQNFRNIIEDIEKSGIIESGKDKEEFIEKLISNLQSELIEDSFDILLSEINRIKSANKIDFYTSVIFIIEGISDEKTVYIERIIQELQKQKITKEELNFEDIDSFKRSIAIRSLNKDDMDQWNNKGQKEKEFIIKFIEQMFNNNPETILEEETILEFFDAIVHKVIKKDKNLDLIVEKYSDLISSLKGPKNMKEFDEMLEKNGFISQERMEDFVEQVTLIRLKETKIPAKYYKYILREAILGNIDKNMYEEIIKKALVDFSQDHLKSLGIINYVISFGKIENKGNENTVGIHKPGYIKISEDYLGTSNITGVINTCFHECRHAEQSKLIEENKFHKRIYAMMKEEIIREYDIDFYKRNYSTMENEIDARICACIRTYEFLLDIGLTPKQIAIYEEKSLEDEIEYDSKRERHLKEDIENNERDINSIVIDILNKKNVKEYILDERPMLQLEFEKNEKGEIRKKDKAQINIEYQEALSIAVDTDERKQIEEIYEYIINGAKKVEDGDYIEYLIEEGYELSNEISEKLKVQESSFEEFIKAMQTPLEDRTRIESVKRLYKYLKKEDKISNFEEAVRQVLYSDIRRTYDKKECIKELFKLLGENKVSQIEVVIRLVLDDLENNFYKMYFIKELYEILGKEERAEKINEAIHQILESNCEEFDKKELIEKLYAMLNKKDRVEKKEQITQQIADSNFSEPYKVYFMHILSEEDFLFEEEKEDLQEGNEDKVELFFKENYYKHTSKERRKVNVELRRQISRERSQLYYKSDI